MHQIHSATVKPALQGSMNQTPDREGLVVGSASAARAIRTYNSALGTIRDNIEPARMDSESSGYDSSVNFQQQNSAKKIMMNNGSSLRVSPSNTIALKNKLRQNNGQRFIDVIRESEDDSLYEQPPMDDQLLDESIQLEQSQTRVQQREGSLPETQTIEDFASLNLGHQQSHSMSITPEKPPKKTKHSPAWPNKKGKILINTIIDEEPHMNRKFDMEGSRTPNKVLNTSI